MSALSIFSSFLPVFLNLYFWFGVVIGAVACVYSPKVFAWVSKQLASVKAKFGSKL